MSAAPTPAATMLPVLANGLLAGVLSIGRSGPSLARRSACGCASTSASCAAASTSSSWRHTTPTEAGVAPVVASPRDEYTGGEEGAATEEAREAVAVSTLAAPASTTLLAPKSPPRSELLVLVVGSCLCLCWWNRGGRMGSSGSSGAGGGDACPGVRRCAASAD